MVNLFSILALALFAGVALAGCSDSGGEVVEDTDIPQIEATATTGGIRGIVVDQAITPVKDAVVSVTGVTKVIKTGAEGTFVIGDLEAGTYLVKASHPLYDTVQQSVDVKAGVDDPPAVKLQLTRTIFATPYVTTEKFDGFIVCSAGHSLVGYSEECGEGVGVPCEVPVVGCQRVGGQGNNNVQYDFFVDSPAVQTILVEMTWEPTAQTAASGQLLTYVSIEWVCDPFCGGNIFITGAGPSPLYLRADVDTVADLDLAPDTIITAFTWANPDTTDPTGNAPIPTVILNQPFQEFVTKSYFLPLPEEWSFVKGDPQPF